MKKRFKVIAFLGIVLMVMFAANLLLQNDVLAGGLTIISADMNDGSGNNIYTISTAVNSMVVVFDPETAVNTNDGIQIAFAAGFNIASIVNGDVTVSQTNSGVNITKGTAAVSGQNLQIPITTEGDTPAGQITITIANSHITTPGSTGTYGITVNTYDLGTDNAFGGAGGAADTLEDAGASAILIGTNQVTISGTVDPSLTLTLSGVTCPLGTLSITNIKTCSYDATVGTNATNGYSSYIRQGDGLKNAAADEITAVAVAEDVTPGGDTAPVDEQYGLGVDTQDTTDVFPDYSAVDTCANLDSQAVNALPSEPLTTSDQKFATYTAPTDDGATHGKTTLCHGASIIATTPAGVYSQVVTLTVVGNF